MSTLARGHATHATHATPPLDNGRHQHLIAKGIAQPGSPASVSTITNVNRRSARPSREFLCGRENRRAS
jgi:hypothetical protein